MPTPPSKKAAKKSAKTKAGSRTSAVTNFAIQLVNVRLSRILYAEKTPPTEKYDTSLQMFVTPRTKSMSAEAFTIAVALELRFADDNKPPFDMSITLDAEFAHHEGLSKQVVEYFRDVNAPLLLWPYFREAVSDITARGGYAPLLLPTLDTQAIKAETEKTRSQNAKLSSGRKK